MSTELAFQVMLIILEAYSKSIKGAPRYAVFMLIQNLFLIPLSLFAVFLVALTEQFPAHTEEVYTAITASMLVACVAVIYLHFMSFNPEYRGMISAIGVPVVDDEELEMALEDYQAYLVNTAHFLLLSATIIGSVLWFMYPTNERLEPLTVILAAVTAWLQYLRSRFKIPNPLDPLFTSEHLSNDETSNRPGSDNNDPQP